MTFEPEAGNPPLPAQHPTEPKRFRTVWRTMMLVLIAAGLLISTLVYAALWNNEHGSRNDRSAAASAAGRFAERFLTLDSRDPTQTERAVLPLATGAFRRTFRQGFEAGLVPALVAIGKVQTVASVKEVFLGDLDAKSAHVIVHVGVVAHPVDQPTATSTRPDSWIELDLVKQQRRWLVDGVGDLKLGPDVTPAATTDTSR